MLSLLLPFCMSKGKSSKARKSSIQQFSLDDLNPILNPTTAPTVAFTVQRISEDGRRQSREVHHACPPSPVKRKIAALGLGKENDAPPRDFGLDFDVDVDSWVPNGWGQEYEVQPKTARKRRYLSSVRVSVHYPFT